MDVDIAAAPQPLAPSDVLGMEPSVYLADLSNAVQDYCADGFDKLEELLRRELPADAATLDRIAAGLDAAYGKLAAAARVDFDRFQRAALEGCFRVPPALLLPAAPAAAAAAPAAEGSAPGEAGAAPPASEAEEAEVDAALAAARGRVAAAQAGARSLRRELAAIERDLAACGPRAAALQAVPSAAAAGGKENAAGGPHAALAAETAAVAADAQKLASLLQRAEALQARGPAGLLHERALPDPIALMESEFGQRRAAAEGATAEVIGRLNEQLWQAGLGAGGRAGLPR